MSFFERYFAKIFLTGFGLIFMAAGVGVGVFATQSFAAQAERAERLTQLAPGAVDRLVPGAELLVEGVLSARNSLRYRSYVAYVREEYRGTDDDGDAEWSEDERVTPPLLLEVGERGGPLLQISNSDYQIQQSYELQQNSDGLVYSSLTDEGTKRYAGLVAERPVTVIGLAQAGSEGPALKADLIYGGTRAAYIESNRAVTVWLPWFGLAFFVAGLIPFGIGLFLIFRRR